MKCPKCKIDLVGNMWKECPKCHYDFSTGKISESYLQKKQKEEEEQNKRLEAQAQRIYELNKEHRMRCNVCGNVFCYTLRDIELNRRMVSRDIQAASRRGVIGGLAGDSVSAYANINMIHKAEEKLIDYSKCPKCQSRDLTEISEDEFKQLNNKSNPTSNPIEEIKKYKELLDMGILTQEEFDTKKRQLLGL